MESDEVFEIVDYSLAGHFERIVHGIEQVLLCEEARVVVGSITVSMSSNHLLNHWTGCSRLVLLALASPADWDTEKLLLSAAQVALRNSGVMTPVFVPVASVWRNMYSGVVVSSDPDKGNVLSEAYTVPAEPEDSSRVKNLLSRYALNSSRVQTRFRMIHSPFIPTEHSDLVGLADLFRDRLQFGHDKDHLLFNPLSSAVYSYALDFDANGDGGYYYDPVSLYQHQSMFPVPMGPSLDPIASINLETHFEAEICAIHLKNKLPLSSYDSLTWKLVATLRSEGLAKHGRLFLKMSSLLDAWIMASSNMPEFTDLSNHQIVSPHQQHQSQQQQQQQQPPASSPKPQQHAPQEPPRSALSLGKTLVKSSIKRLAAAASTSIHEAVAVTAATNLPVHLDPSSSTTNTTSTQLSLLSQFSSLPPSIFNPSHSTTPTTTAASSPTTIESSLRTISALAHAKNPLSAPFDSILWRLCRHALSTLGPSVPTSLARVWSAFVRDLRGRWDSLDFSGGWVDEILVRNTFNSGGGGGGAGNGNGVIDLRDALIFQKVCMLSYCMDRKRRSRKRSGSSSSSSGGGLGNGFSKTEGVLVNNPPPVPASFNRENSGGVVGDESLLALGSRFLSAMGVGDQLYDQNQQNGVSSNGGIPIQRNREQQQQQYHYGQSWNSDISWEDFGTSAGNHHAHQRRHLQDQQPSHKQTDEEVTAEDENSTTEYQQGGCGQDSISSGSGGEAGDMFFDTLDFTDLPKGPGSTSAYPSSLRKQSPSRPTSTASTHANRSGLRSHNPHTSRTGTQADQSFQESASGVQSDDSSGVIIGSTSPPSHMITQGTDNPASTRKRIPSITAADSYVKLPLEVLLTNPEEDDELQQEFMNPHELKDAESVQGGLHPHHTGLLILKTGAVMMVPEVQESGVMTEDMIEEQERMLLALGDSKEAAGVRARMQTGQLKSDMESFKAANAHATLEDFVRWHSPRDWIVDASVEPYGGKLSPRMMEAGNLWHEVWNTARRIPAAGQKPLFHVEKEAEKCLSYLEELSGRGG
ncbi:UNVERIFIED_CONTAM: Rab3 GTPase-activating protein catalytic subunit, partial [Siphonaria sp. JEL0065]